MFSSARLRRMSVATVTTSSPCTGLSRLRLDWALVRSPFPCRWRRGPLPGTRPLRPRHRRRRTIPSRRRRRRRLLPRHLRLGAPVALRLPPTPRRLHRLLPPPHRRPLTRNTARGSYGRRRLVARARAHNLRRQWAHPLHRQFRTRRREACRTRRLRTLRWSRHVARGGRSRCPRRPPRLLGACAPLSSGRELRCRNCSHDFTGGRQPLN